MTAPGSPQPRVSSEAVNTRPATAETPRVLKKSPFTYIPRPKRKRPPGARLKLLEFQAAMLEKACCWSRTRSQIGLVNMGKLPRKFPERPCEFETATCMRSEERRV